MVFFPQKAGPPARMARLFFLSCSIRYTQHLGGVTPFSSAFSHCITAFILVFIFQFKHILFWQISPLTRRSLKKTLLQDILHIPRHRQLFHSFEALSEMPGLHIQNSLGIEAFQLLLLKALFKMKAPGFFSILFPQACGR